MKLSTRQLRALIREELTQARRKGGGRAMLGFAIPEDSPDYGRPADKKIGHLSQLKKVDPRAYAGYLEMLVEDCADEFEMVGGKLTARMPDGTTLTWNPKSTAMDVGGGWEMGG